MPRWTIATAALPGRFWSWRRQLEPVLHLLFWLWYFAAVNVNWTQAWLDPGLRPNHPAPLSVVLFPVLFYLHACWLLPKYLARRRWLAYGLGFLLVFVLPEGLRAGIMISWSVAGDWSEALLSRDSFWLGAPSVCWWALVASTAYRFTIDWFVRQQGSTTPAAEVAASVVEEPDSIRSLTPAEAALLLPTLEQLVVTEKLFQQPDLSLTDLAAHLNTTDKKLSTLLNQYLSTGFYAYLNGYRLRAFLAEVAAGRLDQLSIWGLAKECGFASKSSFYRFFKEATGQTPGAYLRAQR